mmetsp:Transcript_22965/g.54300  ORF Transcript_22965/g.54300 Transcript_22965/m.54300 type:complete len:191 (-) Transcript_22965:110-682(-)
MNESSVKQGGTFLWCCCDYRLAVMMIAGMAIMMSFLMAIVLVVKGQYIDIDNDEEVLPYRLMMYAVCTTVVFHAIGLVGAALFSIRMLMASLVFDVILIALWATFAFIGITVGSEDGKIGVLVVFVLILVPGLIPIVIHLYPTMRLIQEINSGIMSRKTYPREAYSCMCKGRRQYKLEIETRKLLSQNII